MSERYPCADYEARFHDCVRSRFNGEFVRSLYLAVNTRLFLSENPSPCQRELDQYMDCLTGVLVEDIQRGTRQILGNVGENSNNSVEERNGKT